MYTQTRSQIFHTLRITNLRELRMVYILSFWIKWMLREQIRNSRRFVIRTVIDFVNI
jgi:hypothetical protein